PFPLCRRPPPPASSTLSLHDALPIFEARHVAPASVRAAVAPEVRGEGGDAEVRQTLAERRVQAAVLAEVVHEHRCGQRLGGLPAPVVQAQAVDAFEVAVVSRRRRRRGAHPASPPRSSVYSIASADWAARSRISSRSPPNRKRRTSRRS